MLRPDGSIAFDAFNVFAASPAALLRGAVGDVLSASGEFAGVLDAASSANAQYLAEVTVRRLALDCRDDGVRRAVAAVSVRLVRSHGILSYAEGLGSSDASGHDYSAAISSAVTLAFSDALNKL